ncbi:MAG: glycosyltransferase family 39 protein [Candidatus Yonathbacteria bacterium]|nr:glycosyltransferase family 39 protein [Candidatus Yonathbacteria bacterium]
MSTHKLTESPPVWMDEGIITQVAENIAINGVHGIQVAPQKFVSAGFVTTSYVVTYPISLSFRSFGVGVLQARVVMVLFLFAFFVLVYFLTKQEITKTLAVYALLLLVSFAPIYGNGKNVLGEIPGLVFLFAGLLCLGMVERGLRTVAPFLLAGLLLGLCVVTKPVFLLVLPALVIPLYFYHRTFLSRPMFVGYFVLAFCVPVLVWFWVQFSSDSFINILSIYANPHNTSLLGSMFVNLKRLIIEIQPMYFMVLLGIWAVSFVVRLRRKVHISYVELVTFSFSVLIFLAYLRTVGYYRYFFLGQVFALMYFPLAFSTLLGGKIPKFAIGFIFTLLVVFQFYQTGFHSWVASYYQGTRTRELTAYFKTQPPEQIFFLYQVPEVALFLPISTYFQYMKVTSTILPGKEQLGKIREGLPDQIVIISEQYDPKDVMFVKYREKRVVDRYTILEKGPESR